MDFPYIKLPGERFGVIRPFVPVVYSYRSRETKPILSLVDSGADYSFVTFKVAEYLGIKFYGIKPVKIQGFNDSTMDCYPVRTKIMIAEKNFEMPVYYGGSLTREYPCILGQDVFFDKAKISFERYNWLFSITFRR